MFAIWASLLRHHETDNRLKQRLGRSDRGALVADLVIAIRRTMLDIVARLRKELQRSAGRLICASNGVCNGLSFSRPTRQAASRPQEWTVASNPRAAW